MLETCTLAAAVGYRTARGASALLFGRAYQHLVDGHPAWPQARTARVLSTSSPEPALGRTTRCCCRPWMAEVLNGYGGCGSRDSPVRARNPSMSSGRTVCA